MDNNIDDILTNDLSSIDTRSPLLPKGQRVRFKVKEVKINENTEESTGITKRSVAIQLSLNQNAVSTDGQDLRPGTVFFDNIAITPTEKWSADDIKKQLKKFQNACSVSGAFGPVEQYVGRDIEAEVSIQPAKGDYQERNRFRYVDPATGKAQ